MVIEWNFKEIVVIFIAGVSDEKRADAYKVRFMGSSMTHDNYDGNICDVLMITMETFRNVWIIIMLPFNNVLGMTVYLCLPKYICDYPVAWKSRRHNRGAIPIFLLYLFSQC